MIRVACLFDSEILAILTAKNLTFVDILYGKGNIYSAVFAVQAIALNPHAEILYIVVGDWGMTEF